MDLQILARERMREAQKQAEHERLVRLVRSARPGRPWYAGPLALLGARLSTWGSSLETRFSDRTRVVPLVRIQNYR